MVRIPFVTGVVRPEDIAAFLSYIYTCIRINHAKRTMEGHNKTLIDWVIKALGFGAITASASFLAGGGKLHLTALEDLARRLISSKAEALKPEEVFQLCMLLYYKSIHLRWVGTAINVSIMGYSLLSISHRLSKFVTNYVKNLFMVFSEVQYQNAVRLKSLEQLQSIPRLTPRPYTPAVDYNGNILPQNGGQVTTYVPQLANDFAARQKEEIDEKLRLELHERKISEAWDRLMKKRPGGEN